MIDPFLAYHAKGATVKLAKLVIFASSAKIKTFQIPSIYAAHVSVKANLNLNPLKMPLACCNTFLHTKLPKSAASSTSVTLADYIKMLARPSSLLEQS
jgi:hypothetical protein